MGSSFRGPGHEKAVKNVGNLAYPHWWLNCGEQRGNATSFDTHPVITAMLIWWHALVLCDHQRTDGGGWWAFFTAQMLSMYSIGGTAYAHLQLLKSAVLFLWSVGRLSSRQAQPLAGSVPALQILEQDGDDDVRHKLQVLIHPGSTVLRAAELIIIHSGYSRSLNHVLS